MTTKTHHRRFNTVAAVAAVSLLIPTSVRAGHEIFHIFTPTIEQGHWGAELNNAVQTGLPRPGGADDHGAVRAASELGLHADLTPFWMTKLALNFEREAGGDAKLTAIASENILRFDRWTPRVVDVAWFTALSAGTSDDATNAIEFGPVINLATGAWSLTLNPFFEKTFGRNREEGIAFVYAYRAAYTLSEFVSVGIEGYGEVENIAQAPPGREQVHRLGPVLYLGELHGQRSRAHGHSGGHSPSHGHGGSDGNGAEGHAMHEPQTAQWHAEIGVLFGLTDGTPDAAIKLNGGFHY